MIPEGTNPGTGNYQQRPNFIFAWGNSGSRAQLCEVRLQHKSGLLLPPIPQSQLVTALRLALNQDGLHLWSSKSIPQNTGTNNSFHLALTVTDPGGLIALTPLINTVLDGNSCVSNLSILSARWANAEIERLWGQSFTKKCTEDFSGASAAQRNTALVATLGGYRPDALISTIEADQHGPQLLGLCHPDLRNLPHFLYMDEAGVGACLTGPKGAEALRAARIRKVLCGENSSIASGERLLSLDSSHFVVTGSGQLESLALDSLAEQRRRGRSTLKIADDEKMILYLGDVSSDYQTPVHPNSNELTWENVLNAACKAANGSSDQKFVLALRPHPRSDISALRHIVAKATLPFNLRIVEASKETLPINDATNAADLAISNTITEISKSAHYRCIPTAYLLFAQCGAEIIKTLIADTNRRNAFLNDTPNMKLLRDRSALSQLFIDAKIGERPRGIDLPPSDSANAILSAIRSALCQ